MKKFAKIFKVVLGLVAAAIASGAAYTWHP